MNSNARNAIKRLVWSGFFNMNDILEIVTQEMFTPDEIDKEWVVSQIDEEMARKAAAEKNWPEATDCDRLDQVFEELNRFNIIALQNAGYTKSDGIDDVLQAYQERGGKSSPIEGYCFYHGQDLDRAVDGQGLMLTFGDIHGTDAKGLEIAAKIISVLQYYGFDPKWSGTIDKKIEIPGINWQRRSHP
jgi:hypothetical protein